MGPTDARRLSAESLADLRRRVVSAVDAGMTQIEAARVFGVSRRAVGVWVRTHRVSGEAAFRPNRRGRLPGDQFALPLPVQAQVLGVLAAGPPEAAGLAAPLWTRRAVADLVERDHRLRLSPTTVGQYLTRWGIAAEPTLPRGLDPIGRALFDSPPGPGGSVRLPPRPRSRETLWAAWTRPAPGSLGGELLGTGVEVLLAVSGRRATAFLVSRTPYTAADAADFGERLARHSGRGVHVLVCGWPLEHAATLRAWCGARPADGAVRVSLY